MLWSHGLKQRYTAYVKNNESAKNMVASSMIHQDKYMSLIMKTFACKFFPFITTPPSQFTRHPGYQKTQELIECNYYWPGLSTDVHNYYILQKYVPTSRPYGYVPWPHFGGLLTLMLLWKASDSHTKL